MVAGDISRRLGNSAEVLENPSARCVFDAHVLRIRCYSLVMQSFDKWGDASSASFDSLLGR